MNNNKLIFYKNNAAVLIAHIINDTVFNLDFINYNSILGNIYNAKIIDYSSSLELYFLNLGNNLEAVMKKPKSSQRIQNGSKVTVQIVKNAIYDKKATASLNISLNGFYCNYTPNNFGIKLNKNILENTSLKEKIQNELKLIINSSDEGVFIKNNTNEQNINYSIAEVLFLKNLWTEILSNKSLGLIYKPKLLYNVVASHSFLPTIISNNLNTLIELKNSVTNISHFLPLEFSSNLEETEQELVNIALEDCLNNKITINSNIDLIIHETEVFTLIDINFKGSFSLNKDTALFEANKLALHKIAYIIKLKNLSGQILIDALKLHNLDLKNKLLEIFNNYLNNFNVKAKILGFTKLGIIEIVKERKTASFATNALTLCPTCSNGFVPSLNYLLFKSMLEIETILKNNPLQNITIESCEANIKAFKQVHKEKIEELTCFNSQLLKFILNNTIKHAIIIK